MKSKKSSQTAFVVFSLLIVIVAAYLYLKNKDPLTTKETNNVTENFFQKPGGDTTTAEPEIMPQTKTVAELEQTVEAKESKPSDYNLLATTYYQKGEKDKASLTIQEGLIKFPGDDSLLKTKDLIENILPNL